ncbi:Protein ROOT PRIMORDIUM DEFECTIVE 1, partial [Mucuna pruriens]
MAQPRAARFLSLLSRPKPKPIPNQLHLRTIFEGTFKPVRDRGLDHAVEREKHLKPLLSLKNLIKLEPSKSLPASLIKRSLQLPFRPIDFTRKYPSVFEEFLPAATLPHVRLTDQTLRLDAEEQLILQPDRFKHQAADKLLKLLMIARVHKIPLPLIQHLQWDLGLPPDYAETLVPEFPDYFRVVDGFLELVCWSHELSVPVLLQNRGAKGKDEVNNLAFPVQFSTGFEMDKKYETWLREWQTLPYVSPYENASHLSATSDESDRWVVGVLHEILHVFIGKKIEKDCLLEFGEWLGLRSRFKRALLQHPGIFYVSSKIGTYTVVLREGYKRGSLVENHPVMDLRNRYVHLMNSVKEESKGSKVVQGKGAVSEAETKGVEVGEGDKESVEEREEEAHEVEDSSETDFDEDEERSRRGSRKIAPGRRGRDFGKVKLDVDKPFRDSQRGRSPSRDSWRERMPLGDSRRERSPMRDSRRERSPMRDSRRERLPLRDSWRERSPMRDSRRERLPLRDSWRERLPLRDSWRERSPLKDSWRERSIGKTGEMNSLEVSKRRQVRGTHKDVENIQERSRSSKSSRSYFIVVTRGIHCVYTKMRTSICYNSCPRHHKQKRLMRTKGSTIDVGPRLKIAVDVAHGLSYPHFDCAAPHGNLKSSKYIPRPRPRPCCCHAEPREF